MNNALKILLTVLSRSGDIAMFKALREISSLEKRIGRSAKAGVLLVLAGVFASSAVTILLFAGYNLMLDSGIEKYSALGFIFGGITLVSLILLLSAKKIAKKAFSRTDTKEPDESGFSIQDPINFARDFTGEVVSGFLKGLKEGEESAAEPKPEPKATIHRIKTKN